MSEHTLSRYHLLAIKQQVELFKLQYRLNQAFILYPLVNRPQERHRNQAAVPYGGNQDQYLEDGQVERTLPARITYTKDDTLHCETCQEDITTAPMSYPQSLYKHLVNQRHNQYTKFSFQKCTYETESYTVLYYSYR